MKTLKFMLAAATAIGLASATQADQDSNSTGFEKLAVDTPVTTGLIETGAVNSYFYYAGATAEDNESVIAVAGDMTGIARPRGAASVDATRNNILQVSTGTDPLLRTYAPLNGSTPQAAAELTADTYVDTLVQFTVTPYTDTVTPNAADKLMIYLKESVTTNEFGEITDADTNLVVVGGCVVGAEDTLAVAQEYVVQGFHVEGQHQDCSFAPNTWYRLTVKAIVNAGGRSGTYPGFCVYVDGKLCYFDVAAWNEGNRNFRNSEYETANQAKELVLSLLANGSNAASLQGVGFAGEGKVDDIVFSELDPFATVFDFTFAYDTAKVSAIEYTVAGTTYTQARVFPEVSAGTEVQITSITYADDAMEDTITAVNLSDPVEGVYTVTNVGASLTVVAKDAYASVGGSKFDSFAGALSAAANGDTVTLLRDAVGPVSTAASTLDLNGKKLGATKIEFTGTGAKTLTGGDVTNLAAISVISPSGQNLTIDDMTFHFDITPYGTGSVLTVSNCTFENDLDNKGKTGEAADGDDRAYHSFGLKLLANAVFDQADVVGNTFKQARRCGLAINKFVGDAYVYDNAFDGTKNCLNWSETSGGSRFSAMQIYAQGRVFIENNSFTGQYIAEPFALYNEKTNISSDEALVFNGNTVASTVPYLWAFYESPETPLPSVTNAPNLFFGSNTIASEVDKTQGKYKAVVQPVPVEYAENLALPAGYTTVYGWTHADNTTAYYVNDTFAANLTELSVNDVLTAVPGADVTLAVLGIALTPDATYKNKWTVSVLGPSGTELEPGEQSSETYTTQADAATAAAAVTIVAADDIATNETITAQAKTDYLAMFEAKAVETSEGSGVYKVEVALTATAAADLQAQVNADAAEVIEDLDTANVTLTTTPGFYYSFEYGTTLDNMAEVGTRTLATGSTLTLPRPTTANATAGFYKVLVNIAPAAVTPYRVRNNWR